MNQEAISAMRSVLRLALTLAEAENQFAVAKKIRQALALVPETVDQGSVK